MSHFVLIFEDMGSRLKTGEFKALALSQAALISLFSENTLRNPGIRDSAYSLSSFSKLF
jgi:hypothetical protein